MRKVRVDGKRRRATSRFFVLGADRNVAGRLALAALLALAGCGSKNAGGNVDAGGHGGTGGTSGLTGTSGQSGSRGGGGESGTSGTAGSGGHSGSGGTAGAGASGHSGAGGSGGNACAQLQGLDRSCVTDGDCVAIEYMSNCCGGELWTGVPKSAQSTATSLANQCSSSQPLCGCADPSVKTDDGSTVAISFGAPMTISAVAVACQAGRCETYAAICGQPCAAGTFCLSCPNAATDAATAICTKLCPDGGV